jgi:hypothetical protein
MQLHERNAPYNALLGGPRHEHKHSRFHMVWKLPSAGLWMLIYVPTEPRHKQVTNAVQPAAPCSYTLIHT